MKKICCSIYIYGYATQQLGCMWVARFYRDITISFTTQYLSINLISYDEMLCNMVLYFIRLEADDLFSNILYPGLPRSKSAHQPFCK